MVARELAKVSKQRHEFEAGRHLMSADIARETSRLLAKREQGWAEIDAEIRRVEPRSRRLHRALRRIENAVEGERRLRELTLRALDEDDQAALARLER